MTTQEMGIERPSDGLTIARDGVAIRLTWRGDLARDEIERLEDILADLVDGQGNLTLAVDFPDVTSVDLPLLEVLIETEQRLAARAGTLSVTTRTGSWEPATRTIDWRTDA
jgi:hypothetical protein